MRELDPLIGRDTDLDDVLERLDDSRLVTLTGPGGSGKTRLAEAVVERIRRSGGEAWFVDASAVRKPQGILGAITSSLSLEESDPQRPDALIATFLADRSVVIVLDNLEQLGGVGVPVSRLLKDVPGLRILATSRIRLDVGGELEVAVRPLELPANAEPEAVEASTAGMLFLLRAREHGRLGAIDRRTALDIVALLRRLDGLPLAIELAAARTRIMTPGEIVARLDRHGMVAIDGQAKDAHRSVVAIVDWTLGLLSPVDATVLEAVTVCAGFDLDTAEDLNPGIDVLGPIDSLLSFGLVRAIEESGTRRFKVLETVRAEVRSRVSPEAEARYRDRLATAVLRMVTTELHRGNGNSTKVRERLDLEADNIRLALDRLDVTDPGRGLELWSLLFYPFWASRARLREGIARFETTSALVAVPTEQLSRAMVLYAMNAPWVRDEATSRAAMIRALEVAQEVGDRDSEVESLSVLASRAVNEGDADLARRVSTHLDKINSADVRSDQQWRVEEARYFVSAVLTGLASDEAMTHLDAAIGSPSSTRPPQTATSLHGNLAIAHLHRGEYGSAVTAAERATDLARGQRSPLLPWTLATLAMALAEDGKVDRAVEALSGAIEETLSAEMVLQTCDTLLASMPVALAAGEPLIAARLWGAANALEAAGLAEIPPDDGILAERTMDRVRQRSRTIDVELAIRQGADADPQAMLSALPEEIRMRTAAPGSRPTVRHGELTKREVEILTLVGEGLSDIQIADALFISPKTASVHVTNVKAKLEAGSRLEVALRARDLGLVGKADAPERHSGS